MPHSSPDVAVKTIRTLLLVLLALLLPIRGAVAAAMLCPPAAAGMDHHAMMANTDHDEHVGHQHADDHSAGAHDAGKSASAGHHGGGVDKCNLCCDFCSITPLLSALPSVPTPQDLCSVSFPALFAPAPSFLSDGQERPPRSS